MIMGTYHDKFYKVLLQINFVHGGKLYKAVNTLLKYCIPGNMPYHTCIFWYANGYYTHSLLFHSSVMDDHCSWNIHSYTTHISETTQ